MTAVRIHAIATGGDGVGRLPDGVTVFVPRTAPGDLVEIDLTERRSRWARGRIRTLVESSDLRTAPSCPHYEGDACGGCQLQHLTSGAQLAAKGTIVRDLVERVGRRVLDLPEVVPAPAPWRYRTKITLAVTADAAQLGFHRYDHPGTVFDLEDCPIAVAPLMALLRGLRGARDRLPRGVAQVVLRLDREGGGHVVVMGGEPPWDAAAFAEAFPDPTPAMWWKPADGAVRAVAGAGSAFPVLAFQQVNPVLADRIRRDAAAWLTGAGGAVAWDLYGGVGDGARLLAAAGATVWSVDADRSATAWAERQPVPAGPPPTYVAGRVEEVLHRLPEPDLVLLNPPRAGAAHRVTQVLERLGQARRVRRIAYVSCDPATLARDLTRLPSYQLRRVAAYDLFPQTAHVEALALLEAA
jgi:23S rRNA (uracil1939-C5)-methyltransferase